MKRRKGLAVLAALLVFLLLLGFVVPIVMVTMAEAVTQKDIDNLKKQLTDLGLDKKGLKNQISALSGEKASQEDLRRNIDQEMNITEEEIDVLNELIEKLRLDLEEKTEQLNLADQKVDEQYAVLTQRMRATYEAGDLSY
jgi:peptidoglycan hydrolase CwlO-like protein